MASSSASLQELERSIRAVGTEIEELGEQLKCEKDPEERKRLWGAKWQLREKEEQLREKELLLLKSNAQEIPTAGEVLIEALPRVDAFIQKARESIKQLGAVPTVKGKPSLLLAGLGTSFLTQSGDLGKMLDSKGPVVSVVGTSGSGKTRTLLELLCSRIGLYFVADMQGNFGFEDLTLLRSLVLEGVAYDVRAALAQSVVRASVLARLFLLKRCLEVKFSAREWLLLQLLGSQFVQVDICRDLTGSLLVKLEALGVVRRQETLEEEINEQWQQVIGMATDVVVVLDEAQALFELHKDQFKPFGGGTGTRSSFHQVYEALSRPSRGVTAKLLLSATCLAGYKETEVFSPAIAKQLLRGPAFCSFGKFRDTGDMYKYMKNFVAVDDTVDEELLQRFVGRYRPLALVLEDFLEKQRSLNESLKSVRSMLTKEDWEGSYVTVLKRIQVQIHGVELIQLCRMICLTIQYVGKYYCTRKEEVELIHHGLAYLDAVDVDKGEFGLEGTIEEPLVLEALEYYFREDNALLHIMNRLNSPSAGFNLEIAAADALCSFLSAGKFSNHPIFEGATALPDIFCQQLRLWSADSLRLVCSTKGMTSYLAGGVGTAKVLHPEFLAGPDLVIPLKTEDNKELILFAQFRLLNFLDKKKFEQGVSTTNPEFIFRSRKAAKLRAEFKEEVGNRWWKNGIIRLMVVYPAVFKKERMPPAVEVIPAAGGVGPQLKIIIHAGNAKQLFSQERVQGFESWRAQLLGTCSW
ncbi:uncharacterized protein LOC112348768 isoform X2 [Selaginella moellendorffii]|uniref:uncharacterized protein LOC112348765 isoform X2 n=1 Tax=Selaginella moellendorffii TaxID=88036 RepID=UPI000D1C7D94|nr:uncharacterized protein LOC112348765 isoform X2 [Selaginella moellendorffii]XP_024537723.1 uncharacterized protein LOC112348768 isoform X2 [Selaginella moellendorffii]|eukprot:XP_024537704.1 uncharacterized protein LOC112348765 isoform X2 [Selaginella moellendorffii]